MVQGELLSSVDFIIKIFTKKECPPVQRTVEKTIYKEQCKTVNDEKCFGMYNKKGEECVVKNNRQCENVVNKKYSDTV